MWSYYGAKTKIVNLYPPPKYGQIIEPFAGSARYALKYWDREVLLVDKYEVITSIWRWLQKCSKNDVLKLPKKLQYGDSLDSFEFDCREAKWLIGFLIAKGVERPRLKPTERVTVHRPNHINFSLNRIASNLHKIKHWVIMDGTYADVPNTKATWFIDPPYQFGGHAYVMNNKSINFKELAVWCAGRDGQVIVCESNKADWMPFIKLGEQDGTTGKQYEVFWTNEKTSYGNKQQSMF